MQIGQAVMEFAKHYDSNSEMELPDRNTVIYFAKLELVETLEVIRLRNDFQPYH